MQSFNQRNQTDHTDHTKQQTMFDWLYNAVTEWMAPQKDTERETSTTEADYEFVHYTDTQPTPLYITQALTHKLTCYTIWYTKKTLHTLWDIVVYMPPLPPLQSVIN